MMYLAFFALLAVASARDLRDDLSVNMGDLPMQDPDLFGGDMLGVEVTDRNVIPQPHMRWTNKIVPYVLDFSVLKFKPLIEAAMKNYEDNTCIKFVPRTNQPNYIKIFDGGLNKCYSNIGMIGGQQLLSLGQGCMFKGTVVHEFGHALGFFHEQNRSDRDEYLTIYWQNIKSGMDSQFIRLKPNENLLLTPFDHDSIMMYGNRAFSKDGRSMTIEAKNGRPLLEPFEKQGLTTSDIKRVNMMYNCP